MLMAIKRCYCSEPVNSGRQPELDIAKGLAIVFMVWTHVFDELSSSTDGLLAMVVREILGGPFAAPVFMICMGIGISYSKKNEPKDLLRRGIGLLGIGILLNLFRFLLPDIIKYALTLDSKYIHATFMVFSVDILQFAGLAFLFMAVAKKLRLSNTSLMIIGIATSVLGMLLRQVSTGNYYFDQFVGYLWGTDVQSYFPFLNWIIFPLSGIVFGTLFKCCKDKRGFYLRVSPLCGVVMLGYLVLTLRYGTIFMSGGSYFFLSLFDAIFFLILAMGLFGLCYAITRLLPKCSFKPLMRWSRNINVIYCIHLTLLGLISILTQVVLKLDYLSLWQGTLLAVVVLIMSDRFGRLYVEKLKPHMGRSRTS
jgi:uncharacterized membrane protein